MALGLLALLALLLASSAFFSGSETALFSLDRLSLRELEGRRDRASRGALRLLGQPNRLLATLLLGNTLVNVAASSVGTSLFILLYPGHPVWMPLVVMAALILLIGEIVPKCLALSFALPFARGNVGLLGIFARVVNPLVTITTRFADFLVPPRGTGEAPGQELSHSELRDLVAEVQEQGDLSPEETTLAGRVFEFAGTSIDEVMTPWIDVVKVPLQATRSEVEAVLRESRHSRIPVYRRDEDDVAGYLTAKTYLANPGSAMGPHMRPVLVLPEQISARDALRQMRELHRQLAVAVSEHGRPVGIVTAEDLVEEIVGEIYDEFEKSEEQVMALGPGHYRVSGQVPLDLLEERTGLHLSAGDEEFVTLSGYLCHQMGEIPAPGMTIHLDRMVFKILEVDKNRIALCEITVPGGRWP